MASIKTHEQYARALNLDLTEFDELANRMVGFLTKKATMNTKSIKESFFIYADIVERSKEKIAKRWVTSNSELREFGNDIAKLRIAGSGYGTIKEKLRLNSSRSSIATFCKSNDLTKG